MPDRIENLRAHLRQLEAELAAGGAIDPQTQESLEEVADEIRRILAENRPEEPAPATLLERLQIEERAFEASHPTLTQTLSRIIDALGQMGI